MYSIKLGVSGVMSPLDGAVTKRRESSDGLLRTLGIEGEGQGQSGIIQSCITEGLGCHR
jgi:hypothetical protein